MLMFDPSIQSEINRQRIGKQRMINFQVLLEVNDIVIIDLIPLPSSSYEIIDESRLEYMKDYFIQLGVINIGNKRIDEDIQAILRDLKAQGKAVATIFFKVPLLFLSSEPLFSTKMLIKVNEWEKDEKAEKSRELKNNEKAEIAQQVVERLEEKRAKLDSDAVLNVKQSVTHVPFFDVIEENIKGQTEEQTFENYQRFFAIKKRRASTPKRVRAKSQVGGNRPNIGDEESKENSPPLKVEEAPVTKGKFYANAEEISYMPTLTSESDILQANELVQVHCYLFCSHQFSCLNTLLDCEIPSRYLQDARMATCVFKVPTWNQFEYPIPKQREYRRQRPGGSRRQKLYLWCILSTKLACFP